MMIFFRKNIYLNIHNSSSKKMGCQVSNSQDVISPARIEGNPILVDQNQTLNQAPSQLQMHPEPKGHHVIYSEAQLSQLPPLSLKPNQKQPQVNDMPNDPFHFQFLDNAKQLCETKQLEKAEKIANKLFQRGYIDQAIEVYQKLIQADPDYKADIEGIGCNQLNVSHCEWNLFSWYESNKKAGKIKESPYDAMSLCYTLIIGIDKYNSGMKKGLRWYESMINKHPDNWRFYMGLANLHYNMASQDEALRLYDRVIQMKPDLVNTYICKALTYEYKRPNFQKANEMSAKALQICQQNQFAAFIMARNMTDIDQKIQALKKAAQKHPTYPRIVNEVGICYGATKKDYDEAINWYKKCIQTAPQYYSCYNNIGVNNQLKQKYEQARNWYYKALEIKKDYKAPYNNLSDVYCDTNITDETIEKQVNERPKINKAEFYAQIGAAFTDNRKLPTRGVLWQQKAVALDPSQYLYWNQLAMSYDSQGNYAKAVQTYKKCLQLNPEFHIAYYNSAISYKNLNNIEQCTKYYQKAVEVNPKYSYAWNNLGNIYKNRGDYEDAVDHYERAIQYNSTYTLALVNLGYCLVKLGRFKEGFEAFSKGKQALPNDKNNLSAANRTFLNEQLTKYNQEGDKWKKSGSFTDEEKQTLKKLIEEFQNKFVSFTSGQKTVQVPTNKIFNPHVLQIIKTLKQDQFELNKIEVIFDLMTEVFDQDQEYFHIIPLLIIQKFTTSVFQKKRPIMQVQQELKQMMKRISAKVFQKQNNKPSDLVKNIEVKLTQCVPTNRQVNLFTQTAFFKDYFELYMEVNKENSEAKQSYTDFSLLVEECRKKSNGIPAGISTKIPNKSSEQFKVFLRIMEKMFKKQIDQKRTTKIIQKINDSLSALASPSLSVVVKEIMNAWNNQITEILQERNNNKLETKFTISDLLRAKCVYNTVDDLLKAVRVVDSYCKSMNYQIIEVDNRLMKPQTQDVVFKIMIKNAICQLQLAMKQNEMLTHLDHCVYEILRSPLGVIFGSYLFMSKQVKYPLTANCKDISEKADPQQAEMLTIKKCAEYVLEKLQGQKKNS